jgi:hypothetical protein
VARVVGKPFIVGEMSLRPVPGETDEAWADAVFRKMVSAWAMGVDGILIWSYRSPDRDGMTFVRDDALYRKIRYFTEHYLEPGE